MTLHLPSWNTLVRSSIGALIIRRGFWGPIRNPQNSLGNYLDPYITSGSEDSGSAGLGLEEAAAIGSSLFAAYRCGCSCF